MPRRCANVTMLRKENENTIAIIGDDGTSPAEFGQILGGRGT